jgi:hypothetical protein
MRIGKVTIIFSYNVDLDDPEQVEDAEDMLLDDLGSLDQLDQQGLRGYFRHDELLGGTVDDIDETFLERAADRRGISIAEFRATYPVSKPTEESKDPQIQKGRVITKKGKP